ncbi:MAG: hypothetical protein H0X60_05195, partial [Chloroflexi bacterium]|nr:hypothetical protein [Chloroflexota bacterium]
MRFLRRPERITRLGLILWAFRIAIIVFVVAGSYATLSGASGVVLSPEGWRDLVIFG